MIDVEINEDSRKYELKIFLGMTKRQLLCAAVGSILALILFAILPKEKISLEIRAFVAVLPLLPCWAIGWWKPYNIPAEQYIKILLANFFAPPIRKTVIKNQFYEDYKKMEKAEKLAEDNKKGKEKKNKAKKKKVNTKTAQVGMRPLP